MLADPETLPAALPPVLRRVYAARGIDQGELLDLGLGCLLPPAELGGLERAVTLLADAIAEDRAVTVIGDFDADGATSVAVCLRGLRALGLARIDYLVPNRFEFGYGLTPEIVAVAAERSPDLLLTVDNGVASVAGVDAARAAGMQVIVTDHHLPGARLPAADAIVNPNLPDNPFPSKHLAGVGVAFYLLLGVRAELRARGWFGGGRAEPNLAELLDLVALGTVADVVPLDRNNRILVEQGLRRIRARKAAPGILALLEAGRRDPARVVATDLGFVAGPRLNAAGRLEDMSLGIECLLTEDPGAAREIAGRLDALNRERREIEADMKAQALAELEALHLDQARDLPTGVALYRPDWHQGVIGILAARVREAWHRPVVAFAHAGNGELKGSARSIPGFHIRDALDAVDKRHPGLIRKFGGHAMAAGLSLGEDAFEAFREAFDAEAARLLDADDLHEVLHTDGELAAEELTLETAHALRRAGPWGQGFPEPSFEGRFRVRASRIVGEHHLKLTLELAGRPLDAIAFNQAERAVAVGEELALVYRLDVNEWRGTESLQLVVEAIL